MTGSLKEEGLKTIKEILNKHGITFTMSANILANQFLETGNYSTRSMALFLNKAFDLVNNELAEELSENLISIIKAEAGN